MCPVFREQPYHVGEVVYLILLMSSEAGRGEGSCPGSGSAARKEGAGCAARQSDSGACTVPARLCFGRVPLSNPNVPQDPVDSGNEGPLAGHGAYLWASGG